MKCAQVHKVIIKYKSEPKYALLKKAHNLHELILKRYNKVVKFFTIALFRQRWTRLYVIHQNKSTDISAFTVQIYG